jgi:hypothetical protein
MSTLDNTPRFWKGFGEPTRLREKENTLASIVTVNVPQYAVRATLSEIFGVYGSLTPSMQTEMLNLAKTAASTATEVELVCPTEAVAKTILGIINPKSNRRTVKVDSFSRWGLFYDVTLEGNVPISCTCPDFVNRSVGNPLHQCKHILHVSRNLNRYKA